MNDSANFNPALRSLTVIARLLDYPSSELQQAGAAMVDIIHAETRWPAEQRQQLAAFIEQLAQSSLLEIQADYIETFDRGRAHSLLLFEHVHGESRARGQAMVDLLQQYRNDGLELAAKELPDYIPLYLEYLATRSPEQAAQGIGDVSAILALLSARLQEHGNTYHLLFDALLSLVGIQADMVALRKKAANEVRDNTPAAMDKVWEEEMVSFIAGDASACGNQMKPTVEVEQPIHLMRQPQTHTLHFQEN